MVFERRQTPPRVWLIWLAVFVLSLPAVTTRLYASDEIEYFAFLRSLWFDRDLSFDNEYRYFYDRGIARAHGFHETFLELTTETGLRYNFGTIGSAILWAPFYAVADLGVRIARAAGANVEADGYSWPYIAAVTYGSAVYGFLALLLSIPIARRLTGGGGHLPAAVVWIATPLAFYMYLSPGMSHACSAFAVALFVTIWLHVRDRWTPSGCFALGVSAALMTMVREQDAFFAIGPLADFLWPSAGSGRSPLADWSARLRASVAGLTGVAIAFAPQAWAYLVLNGRLAPASPVSAKMRWYSPHAAQVLFSPEHGFMFWTPLAILSVIGLLALARSARATTQGGEIRDRQWIALCLLMMFAAQVYIAGSVDTWTVAGAFGQRRFVSTTVILVVGLAALWQIASARRALLTGIVALTIWWNVGLMVQFGAGLMDRQRLTLATNAYNTFIVVPLSLPELTWRFLFDRSSFFKPSPPSAPPQ